MNTAINKSILTLLLLTCVCLANAYEEILPLQFRLGHETVYTVTDLDAEKNVISLYTYPSRHARGATVARDNTAGMEVFRPDNSKMCYARPIPTNVNAVSDYKSVVEEAKASKIKKFVPEKEYKEFLKCTGKRIPETRLGRVGYLCKGIPIYEVKTESAAIAKIKTLKRVKRDDEYFCWGLCWGKRKRDLTTNPCSYARVTNFSNCPPQK